MTHMGGERVCVLYLSWSFLIYKYIFVIYILVVCFHRGSFNEDGNAHEQPSSAQRLFRWGLHDNQDTHDRKFTPASVKILSRMMYNRLIFWMYLTPLLPSETARHCHQCGEAGEGSHSGMLCSVSRVFSHCWCCAVTKLCTSFVQDSELPQFNETFLVNLRGLKQHMNDSEWQVKPSTHLHGNY